jgi:ubiquinone/menaquinone biosynthesis C-methylase UbiE
MSAALVCQSCAKTFPLWHGVPNFSAATDYYYGEFPQAMMRSIIETAAQEGSAKAFEIALKDQTDGWRRYFLHYAADETRAAWQFLLHLPANASALDMGCGWGNLSISLARNFAMVYAMDLVPERAVISGLRAREAGLENVRALAGGNTTHLPFPDASLDAVTLNGVLEWVATSFPQVNDPREAQLRVLREIVRVLKPDGQLYIGIENRLGFLYFLGRPDEHSRLKFTTLLPRWLANRYSLVKRNQQYRTYTYTWRGYRKLLREAGIPDTRFYCPFPEYREFSDLIDLDRPRNLAAALHPTSLVGRGGMQVCKRLNLFREFSPSYSIVASKAPEEERFVDRLLRHIGVTTSEDVRIHVTRTAAALLFTPKVLVRLPLTSRAQMRMAVEAANLRTIASPQRPLVPQPIAEGEYQGQAYFATRTFPGITGLKFLGDHEKLSPALRQATDFLIGFHRDTQREQVCNDQWVHDNFDWLVDSICERGADVAELKVLCRHGLLGKRVLNVMSHGDFSLQNLVFDPHAIKLTGVVDWDLAEQQGWPFQDLIHLLAAVEYETKETPVGQAALTVLERLRNTASLEHDFAKTYLAVMQLEPEQIVWAIQRYFLRTIHDKYQYGDRKIAPLLKNLSAELAAARSLTREWLASGPSAVSTATSSRKHMGDFTVPAPRLEELAQELSAYKGIPINQVRNRLEEEVHGLGSHIAEEWHKRRPVTGRQIERFYEETDAYLYELLVDGESPSRNQTRDAILQVLREMNAQRIFEFGGGIGTDAMWFTHAGLQWTYYDLPSGQTFKFATWRFAKNKLPVTVATRPEQSHDNDAVVSVEVFEHLPDLLMALRAINRTLRLGGMLIFTESFGKTERHPLHLTRTAIQGRFLNELVQAAGFGPVQRFGPEDCLYRTVKRRSAASYDYPHAVLLICARVVRKVPSKLWRMLVRRS